MTVENSCRGDLNVIDEEACEVVYSVRVDEPADGPFKGHDIRTE